MDKMDLNPIFEYLDGFKKEIHSRLDNHDKKIEHIQTTLDVVSKNLKDLSDEHIVLHRRVEKLEAKVNT